MNPQVADQILVEWDAARDRSVEPALQTVDAALFLEDTFGVVVSDHVMDGGFLGTLDGLRAVLARERAR